MLVPPTMASVEQQANGGPYVHLGLSFHLQESTTKFDYTFDEDASSLGSSVKSGLRNSLHSSYDFQDVEELDDCSTSGSDDEFGCDVSDRSVSWRQDPKESHSDWTMTVESVPDGTITEYHVHKHMLAEGFKKSEFFAGLFNLSKEKKVANDGSSTTKVHANAASLVPDMLDFLYSSTDDLKISTETAVGLRHLSEFFGIRALARRTVTFIYEDLCIDNVRLYLLCAAAFDDLQTQKLCAQTCAENLERIDPYSDLLSEMDPSFLLDVISCQTMDRRRLSPHMSKLVSVYCELCGDVLDGTVFEELTTVEYLPIVSEECAIDLMLLEDQLVEEASDERPGLTYLQKRCVTALVPHMDYKKCSDKNEQQRALKKKMEFLPKKILIELLSRSLCISSS